jgi:hypothetical protein
MYIEYTTDRLILASFGILIMLFFIICYPFARTHSGLRSFYNKISLTRVIIGICLLTYLVVFKYLLVFFDAAIKNFDQLLNNEAVASLFLGLDITDVICLAMILCLFFDRGNNFIRYLAPISFIIGFYTLVFNVLCAFSPDQLSMVKFNAQYFFLGYDGANVAYLTCIFNLALGLWYTMDEKVVI